MKRFSNCIFFFLISILLCSGICFADENSQDVKNRIDFLTGEIRRHNELYDAGKPEITDQAYDRLFRELAELEKKHPSLVRPDSPTRKISSASSSEGLTVSHTVPMLSLRKCGSVNELKEWMMKLKEQAGGNLLFVGEEKIDGAAVELTYTSGRFVSASTRGDGKKGRDVTDILSGVAGVPSALSRPVDIAVRGEVFIRKSALSSSNKSSETVHDAVLRNRVAGILHKNQPSDLDRNLMEVIVFEAAGTGFSGISSHWALLSYLKSLGFNTNPSNRRISKAAALETYIADTESRRKESDLPLDGIVLKADDLTVRKKLGATDRAPLWAMAYKFEADQAATVIEQIDVRIGRLGKATPVAVFQPVQVSGATLHRASLHNQKAVTGLKLDVGDTVLVARKGGVIPSIIGVIEKHSLKSSVWQMPSVCPVCGAGLISKGRHHYCPNWECPAQIKGRLVYFARKMGIRHLGEETVSGMADQGILKYPEDIFRLEPSDLNAIPRFSEKAVREFLESCDAARQEPFQTCLVALSIPGLGKKTVRLLAEAGYLSADQIMNAKIEELVKISGIGRKTAMKIQNGFHPRIRETVRALKAQGVNL